MKPHVLVLGCGRSGTEAAALLLKKQESVVLYDGNESLDKAAIRERVGTEGDLRIVLGPLSAEAVSGARFAVISPGISVESPVAKAVSGSGIPLISEIELAYRYELGNVIGITGTNGKTTTTTLVGEIMKEAFREDRAFTVGNIGVPYTREVLKSAPDSVSTIELSSFQLETIRTFHPKVAAILNITPDHLDRHHTMENYARVKERIFENAGEKDTIVLNAEDPYLRPFGESVTKGNVVWFSGEKALENGYFLEGRTLYKAVNGQRTKLIDTDETTLVGRCNYENILAAVAVADTYGVRPEVTLRVVKRFRAVPHRIEYTATVGGVKYYNDSKGTNPDAAIQGIRAMDGPTILIGGGYDKGLEFDDWIREFGDKVKRLILIGQTREKIRDTAVRLGFTAVEFAGSLEEAVERVHELGRPGDNVLLSPACASWGMFDNYEQRGDLFKALVRNYLKDEREG